MSGPFQYFFERLAMKLIFSLQAEDLLQLQNKIQTTVEDLYPAYPAHIDPKAAQLVLCVPDDANVLDISDKLCAALAEIGVGAKKTVVRAAEKPPVRRIKDKRQSSVSIPVFAVSLICVALAVFILGFSLAGGFVTSVRETTLGTGQQEGESYADKIALIDSIFEHYSLYDTDGKRLLDTMLKAYAMATDDRYAAYYTDEEYAALMAENSGDAVGIGISVMKDPDSDNMLIVRVVPGTPAALAGVKPGDLITHVGSGEQKAAVGEIGYDAASNRMIGEADSIADFTVLRDGAELSFSVTRAKIETVSAIGRVSVTDPTVGIIKIYEFNITTPADFKKAVGEMQAAGCTKLIFDLRDNPGGDLNSISAVLSYFLEEGQTILTTTYKDGSGEIYKVKPVTYEGENAEYGPCNVAREEIGMYRNVFEKMVVLTNGYTASAAELFTIVMKDYGLAKSVGDTTYGKGIIQTIFPLKSEGFGGAVKLTVGYYNPPISENYDKKGIAPDVAVSLGEDADSIILELLPEGSDPQLQAAISECNTK